MYDHGFAMLGLSEAYGAVDESLLWQEGAAGRKRGIGEALKGGTGFPPGTALYYLTGSRRDALGDPAGAVGGGCGRRQP